MFSRSDVAAHFGATPETVRRWSKDFAKFLSISANDSNKSEYTDDDMEVLVYVSESYKAKKTTESIILELAAGNRGEWNGVIKPQTIVLSDDKAESFFELQEQFQDMVQELMKAKLEVEMWKERAQDADSLREQIGVLKFILKQHGIDPETGKKG